MSVALATRKPWRLIIVYALCVILGAGVVLACLPKGADLVTVARLSPSGGSGLVTFQVRPQTPRSIRFDTAEVYARFGDKFGLVSHVNLGTTTSQSFKFDVQAPGVGRQWKVMVAYRPQVDNQYGKVRLTWWRLKHAWETRSISKGFSIAGGWEAERHAQSELFRE